MDLWEIAMDERTRKAFDFSADTTKQLITLATAILVLTITFAKDILDGISEDTLRWSLGLAWVLYLISLLCGVATLMALTGTLQPKSQDQISPPTYMAR